MAFSNYVSLFNGSEEIARIDTSYIKDSIENSKLNTLRPGRHLQIGGMSAMVGKKTYPVKGSLQLMVEGKEGTTWENGELI